MFNQSLWGVFAHKDLVQTQPWHWLGGDLEGDLALLCWVDVPPSAAKSLSRHQRTWFCCHPVH